ncbi:MAG TPA: TorF family putative porin [Burkholderiales bacterium]|nr:TorF family putative porin [Burkholderiales bacterium]
MKQLIAASAVAAAVAMPAVAFAQAAPAPASPHTFSYNLGFFSEYIFRGVTQTGGKPAVQGGFDYGHESGLYAGTWASNASWLEDFSYYTRSSMEWDFYGGYKWAFANDFGLDVGTIYYYYPGSRNAGIPSADTWEIYVAGTWKFLGAKFSYSLQDYFGARPIGQKTDGSWYLDLFGNYAFGDSGWSLNAHYGILDVANDGTQAAGTEASYNDWRIGGAYTVQSGPVKGLEIGLYYTDTDVKNGAAGTNFYTSNVTTANPAGYNTAQDAFVLYVKKTF